MRTDAGGEIVAIEVPSREPVAVGDPVRIEISLGALSDEVEIDGRVEAIRVADGPPIVVIRLSDDHRPRARYARAVLNGDRPASARSHRRIPTDLECRWSQGALRHNSRIRDLSRGGAFIASSFFPEIGSVVDVRLLGLQLQGVVSWLRPKGQHAGFGVMFKLRDRDVAEQLSRVLREQEGR